MKALIFSMTCGEGHNMMAKSLAQAFDEAGIENKIVQTHGYSKKREERENKMFLWACKHIPHIYDLIWNRLRKKDHTTDKLPYYVKNCLNYFDEQIKSFDPDIIVCTHFYASSVLTYMKSQKMLKPNIVTGTILVDFCLAPYWEHSVGVDYVFQPFDNTTQDLIKKGFKQDQIITTGLPIRKQFYEAGDKIALRNKLGIKDAFTVMIVGGGNAIGKPLKVVRSILKENDDAQIIVVNGKNEKSKTEIDRFIKMSNCSDIINLGFISNMHEYLAASDVVITRCGSSCLTEIISVCRPFIMREKMILNEKINKKYFIENGCGLGMKKISDAGKLVKYLKNNPKIYEKMQKNIEKLQKPFPAQKIVEFLASKSKQN